MRSPSLPSSCMGSRSAHNSDASSPSGRSDPGQRSRDDRSEPGWHAWSGRTHECPSRSAGRCQSPRKPEGCSRMAIRSDGVYRPLDLVGLLILYTHHGPSLSCPWRDFCAHHLSLLLSWFYHPWAFPILSQLIFAGLSFVLHAGMADPSRLANGFYAAHSFKRSLTKLCREKPGRVRFCELNCRR